jgi:REP element-mobilizing transposase RayT
VNNEVNLNELGNIVLNVWESLPNKYSNIQLDEFVIMPNHLHGVILITDVESIHEPLQEPIIVGTIHELSLR